MLFEDAVEIIDLFLLLLNLVVQFLLDPFTVFKFLSGLLLDLFDSRLVFFALLLKCLLQLFLRLPEILFYRYGRFFLELCNVCRLLSLTLGCNRIDGRHDLVQ